MTAEVPGAGVVTNLAAGVPIPQLPNTVRERDVYLIGEQLRAHPWYRVNPEHDHPAEGMAVVLLRRQHTPFGALCFTWETSVVPTAGSRADEMIDICNAGPKLSVSACRACIACVKS